MKIEIDMEHIDILESYGSYDGESKDTTHRRWGRMSWLHPGDIVVQVSGDSAKAIEKEIASKEDSYT